MATVLRRSGPDFERAGKTITPRAMVHFCETCDYEGAGFGVHQGGKLLSFCGWQNGAPVCVGKAAKDAA